MQRADHRLVRANRFAIRAVAQPIDDSPDVGPLALRRKPQRGKGPAQPVLGSRAGLIARQLTTELASRALDLAQAPWAGRSAARKPARQLLVGVGGLPAGQGVRRDRPAVARPPARLSHALARHEPGVLKTIEMNPHPTGVKRQLCGQFIGAGRAPKARKPRE